MDVHIYSVKLTVKQVNKSLYDDNTKRLKPQDTQLEISKIYAYTRKFRERTLGLRICLWEYTQKANFEIHLPPKSFRNFTKWFKEGRSCTMVIA